VLAHAVEAHRLRQLDVAAVGVVVGRGQTTLRPVALVEHELERERAAVEDESVCAERDRSHRGVAAGRVEQVAARVDQLELRVDQLWRGRAPQQRVALVVDAGVGQLNRAPDLVAGHVVHVLNQRPLARVQPDAELCAFRPRARDARVKLDLPSLDAGRPLE
jgi:hypothetical protein